MLTKSFQKIHRSRKRKCRSINEPAFFGEISRGIPKRVFGLAVFPRVISLPERKRERESFANGAAKTAIGLAIPKTAYFLFEKTVILYHRHKLGNGLSVPPRLPAANFFLSKRY